MSDATNAANVAGLIASGQPFVVGVDGVPVAVSTHAEVDAFNAAAVARSVEPVSVPVVDVEPVVEAVVPVAPKKAQKAAQKRNAKKA